MIQLAGAEAFHVVGKRGASGIKPGTQQSYGATITTVASSDAAGGNPARHPHNRETARIT